MNPYVNIQSEPMGTDGLTDKRTNGRTDKYLLIYSGISSHSLRGVRIAVLIICTNSGFPLDWFCFASVTSSSYFCCGCSLTCVAKLCLVNLNLSPSTFFASLCCSFVSPSTFFAHFNICGTSGSRICKAHSSNERTDS